MYYLKIYTLVVFCSVLLARSISIPLPQGLPSVATVIVENPGVPKDGAQPYTPGSDTLVPKGSASGSGDFPHMKTKSDKQDLKRHATLAINKLKHVREGLNKAVSSIWGDCNLTVSHTLYIRLILLFSYIFRKLIHA